ncbi:response regulator transcription factor [uncultured Bacteroides sp.]|nr:LuxR C-terminal-related transcriptional regulator [uncultured Bacteroides sp.]
MTEIGKQDSTRILSVREKQVLSLIDKGLTSKKIAETLSISINTVSRHRQEILGKLQVKNSIEACRVAKDLKLI